MAKNKKSNTKKSRYKTKPACTARDFRIKVDYLRALCPPPRGTSLKVFRIADVEVSDCEKDGRQFVIRVNPGLTETETEDALIHEWAHMMTWRPHHPLIQAHGPEWGVAFAMVYRSYYEVQ